MSCRDAIREVFRGQAGEMTSNEVIARIFERDPDAPCRPSTIRTYLIGLSVNHSSGRHYPTLQRHAFLVSLGNGRYRLWDAARDEGPIPQQAQDHDSRTSPTSPIRDQDRFGATSPRPTGRPKASSQTVRRASSTKPAVDEAARQDLIRRLVREIDSEAFQPRYRRKPVGRPLTGWPARYSAYFWPKPGMGLRETARLMDPWFAEAGDLAERLQANGDWSPSERSRAACLAWSMLSWGGVTRQEEFSESTVEAVFRRALGMPTPGWVPMNSGWTKVAALATAYLEGHPERYPHVIWDSRVSTALTWRLDRMMAADGMDEPRSVFPRIGAVQGRGGSRPRSLQLRWANAYMSWPSQGAGSELVREIRDHLNEGAYPPMPHPDGTEAPWTMRGVESVLFMDGY